MMLEMQEDATGTRAKNFMYIASFNPAEGEVLSEAQWDRVYEIFEKERGIPEGQQRIVYEHEKKGRIHRHVVWIRIDVEKMRAFPDALDLKVCEAAKHKIEAELDLQRTPGLLNRDPELPPADRRPKSWEMFRGMKSGIDPVDLKAEVTGLYKESANAADFVARLEAHGYSLCMGDRRGFVILDHAGDTHSLVRRLAGINTKQLNEFMEGIDRASLPSVDQAKERLQERKAEAQKADRATVVDEIQWQDALNKAAIAKEEKERRYVEKEPRQAERLAQPEKPQGQQAGQQGKKEATDAEHLAELAGPLAGKPEKPQGLQGTSAQIWEAMQRRTAPRLLSRPLQREAYNLRVSPSRTAAPINRPRTTARTATGPRFNLAAMLAMCSRRTPSALNSCSAAHRRLILPMVESPRTNTPKPLLPPRLEPMLLSTSAAICITSTSARPAFIPPRFRAS
jgi:hypothetical protein